MNRLQGLGIVRPPGLPHLTIAQRVIDKIVANALIYDTETGESLVGLALKVTGQTEPDLYVLDTIPPDESAVRGGAYFEQGDELQSHVFNWWYDNWQQFRTRRLSSTPDGSKWDAPLAYLGDWHKHPGDLVEPSGGDTFTARDHLNDKIAGTPHILVILATVWDRARAEHSPAAIDPANPPAKATESKLDDQPQPLKIPIDNNLLVRVDCWYMSRHTRRFVRLQPHVAEDYQLPSLGVISWDLAQPERWQKEIKALTQAGYSTSFEVFDSDQQPPLEICITLAKINSENVLIVVTQADYPATRPTIRFTPMTAVKSIPDGANLFKAVWAASLPLPDSAYPTEAWTPDQTLLNLVREVDERLTADPSTHNSAGSQTL